MKYRYVLTIAVLFLILPMTSGVAQEIDQMSVIRNAIYRVQYDDKTQEKAKFTNGVFTKDDLANDLKYFFEIAQKPMLVTDLGVAYVVMWTSKGGSGGWATIKVIDLKTNPPDEIKSFPQIAEDRIQIESLLLNGKHLILKVLRHGPEDALCCPTQKGIIKYSLQ